MKLAIIGSGPLALYCAQHFEALGAHVVLFQRSPLGGRVRFLKKYFPEAQLKVFGQSKNLENFWLDHLKPLIIELEEKEITKAGEVLRVHKRFLNPTESAGDKSRLHDLFRVIYSVNPQDSILKQIQENPEIFKQLGDQVIDSLHLPVESFEDFDLVIEATGRGQALSMGASHAAALNENNLKSNAPIFYENEIFSKLDFSDKKNIVIVGDTDSAVLALLKCQDWLWSSPEHRLSWVTPSRADKSLGHPWYNLQLEMILSKSKALYEKDKQVYEQKLFEWRDLEDYMKAKVAKPLEPVAKISLYVGYNITAVDKLLDRNGVFATIESPDFREYAQAHGDLKTLPADAILVSNGFDCESNLAKGMNLSEPGYYRLQATSFDEGLAQIKKIEEKIMSFFSRTI